MVPTPAPNATPGARTAAVILHAVGGLIDTSQVRAEVAGIVADMTADGQLDTGVIDDLKVLAAPALVGQEAAEDLLNLICAAENLAAVRDGNWAGLWPDLHLFRNDRERAEARAAADYQHCLATARADLEDAA
jgi:hypothetical protein